ncbi:class F sortase [Streptomyces sp. NPDC056411]|uniref:class F sortase n=1 Tax=Streptomyces sp. NPDC056411 TaxID=3345813 RepID=UPI0035DC5D38
MSSDRAGRHRSGHLLAGTAWTVLLLGLWLWGRDLPDGAPARLATTGDVAAVGRPLGRQAPPHTHAPVSAPASVRPQRIVIGAPGAPAAGVVARPLAPDGTPAPPPDGAAAVGWYAGGPQPGEAGAALLAVPSGAPAPHAALRQLTGITPGERVTVRRSDGSTVHFVVEDVQLFDRARFDARTARAARDPGRAELRLIGLRGATPSPGRGALAVSEVVVVSAYMTDYQSSGATARG